jgi:hypothetical protein
MMDYYVVSSLRGKTGRIEMLVKLGLGDRVSALISDAV